MNDPLSGGTPSRIQYIQAEPGGMRIFDYPFQILADSDLTVAVNDAILDPETYFVGGIGNPGGGEVSLTEPPEVGSRITLWRAMPFTMDDAFAAGTEIRAANLNAAFERLTMMVQQVADETANAIHTSVTDLDRDLTLPSVAERAGRYLSFDADGRPEAVTARFIGDMQNLGLVYLGAHATISAPTNRLNGTSLQVGDLYFDIDADAMNIWRPGGWTTAATPDATLFRHDGSLAMSGDLDLGGHDIVHPGLIDGRDVAADGAVLDALKEIIADWEFTTRYIAMRNAWEIAQLRGLTVHALANTYLDTFQDLSGVETGMMPIGTNEGAVISGTDGSINVVNGLWGPDYAFDGGVHDTGAQAIGDPTYFYIGKDWGAGNARTITKIRAWGEPGTLGFAAQVTTCALSFQASNSGAWAGEETILWSDPSFADPGGAFVEIEIADTTSAFRFHRFLIEETEEAQELQVMNLTLFEGLDLPLSSSGIRLDQVNGGVANGDGPHSVLSSTEHWSTRAGFAHSGDAISVSPNAGAIRTKLPLIGNFDVTLTLGTVSANGLWRFGLFEQGEIAKFDPSLILGGLPVDPASSEGIGIDNGIGLSIEQDSLQILKVQDNVAGPDGSASVGLVTGDRLTIRRRADVLSILVNDTGVIETTLDPETAYYAVLGSGAEACDFESLSWTEWQDEPMELISAPVQADGIVNDLHILVETEGLYSGENTLPLSNDFLAAPWIQAGTTLEVLSDQSGSRLGFRLTETETPGVHALIRIVPIRPGQTYTASLFAKADERTRLRLLWGNQSTSRYGYAIYDLESGTVGSPVSIGTASPFAATIIPAGSGWYRCVLTGLLDTNSDQGQFSVYCLNESGQSQYPGNVEQGLSISGAQLEAAEIAGPYFETSDSAPPPRPVLGRDVEISVSSDAGTSWQIAKLVRPPLQSSDHLIAHYFAELTGVPQGADLRIRFSLDRAESVRLKRWALQADCPLLLND
ncbi:MAG: hypothetical protein JJ881_12830 [Alphaproteobacteria bacterium]|nr:hypothetical protein [Alphaproteobacteria bacterium]